MKGSNQDLHGLCDAVDSKESFIRFVRALSDDFISGGFEEESDKKWENGSIDTFLESIAAYAEDSPHISETSSWADFARLIFSGKWYE